MSNPIERILNAANSAATTLSIEESTSQIQNLMQSTRGLFRRRSSRSNFAEGTPTKTSKRGRKKQNIYKRKVFLMKLANADFLPGSSEQAFLKRRGLGAAKNMVEINRNWTIDELKQNLTLLYPSHITDLINMSDFHIAKCDRQKKLIILNNLVNAADLEDQLGLGVLILVPTRSFPNDLPLIHEPTEESFVLDAEYQSDFESPSSSNSNRSSRRVLAQTTNEVPNCYHGQNSTIPQFIRSTRPESSEQTISPSPPLFDIVIEDEEDYHANVNLETVFPSLDEHAPICRITVNREDIVKNMFNLYKDEKTPSSLLLVKFEGEDGIDGGGLTSELFTIFWNTICSSGLYFKGHDAKVPYMPLHLWKKKKSDYVVLGRILEHTIYSTKSVPHQLARFTYVALSNKLSSDIQSYVNETLLNEYLLYLTPSERRLVYKAMNSFDKLLPKEKDRLTSLFTANGYYDNPRHEEITGQITAIAEKIIIRDTKDLYEEMKSGFSVGMVSFLTNLPFQDISNEWKKTQPTPEKIMDCLVLSTMYVSDDQEKTFFYLQNYVGSLSQEKLLNFLLFTTGSVNMPNSKITVGFHEYVGIGRRPIAHTCSNLIELATNYDTQQEFNYEMDAYLNNAESYKYDLN